MLIELRAVGRSYPNGTVALDGVDLAIAPGESVAVVGRSGSGKSTLLSILGLLDQPSSGKLSIDGRRVDSVSDGERTRLRAAELGFVFQRSHLIPGLSVRDNVLLGLRYAPVVGDLRRAADDALSAVGLENRADAPARTLSGGEMQRVAIARTLARPARLWLADEPTGNLDSAQSAEIIELLKARAAERGAALVVVTHEPEIAARLDRTVTLADGRVVADTGTARPSPPPRATAPTSAEDGPGRAVARPARPSRRTLRARWARTARFIAQGVVAHPGRSRSGVAASAVAVALTVAALGLSQSAAAQVTALFDAERATQVTAQLASDTGEARWPIRTEAVRDFPGVTGVEHWRLRSSVPLANGAVAALDVELVEVDAAPGPATESAVTWAAADDGVLDPGEVLLGAVIAERLGITQLDLLPEVTLDGARLRVVGVVTASRSGNAVGSAFVTPADTTTLPPSLSSNLYVTTAPGAARTVADRLEALADPFGTTRMTVDPVLAADAYRGRLQSSVAVSLQVLAVVASLAGLAAVVFVNLLGVAARTAEFGVRRAFGASRRELVSLVVGECTALGTLGGLPPAIAAGRIQPADAVRA
ncbi:MAG: ATP-binding cassette domain-containing protein [Cellulomonadaceae bacterium]